MTGSFSYATRARRVVFGAGTFAAVPGELKRLGPNRVVLVGTPGRAVQMSALRAMLGGSVVGTFEQARVHVPGESLRQALDLVRHATADCVIALGGGSAIGLAKAIAREAALQVVAVPTTYSGSEMTAIWGVTNGETKRTGRDARVAPVLVIYDPSLTASLSAKTSAVSGLNAVAHCVEALYAPDASPMSTLCATEGLTLLAGALPRVVNQPDDLPARADALLGAHFAGLALDLAEMGLHHKLAHVLGGLGLPHALTHAILLPHVVEFNAPAAPEAMALVARVLQATDAASGIRALARGLGITETLRDAGLQRGSIARAAELAGQGNYPNPGSATPEAVAAILERAW